MKRKIVIAALLLCAAAVVTPVQSATAKSTADVSTPDANGNGTVRSHKTGATAQVGSAYASRFQGYIDDLETQGAIVYFMGGIRRGHCWSGGLHPCGKALDVCQLSRGRVDPKCHLPGRSAIAAIAARHDLFEGGQWCSSDYGHAQVGMTAEACGGTIMSARSRITRESSAVLPSIMDRFGAGQ